MESPKYQAGRPVKTFNESFKDCKWVVEIKKVSVPIQGIKQQGRAWVGLLWAPRKVRNPVTEDKCSRQRLGVIVHTSRDIQNDGCVYPVLSGWPKATRTGDSTPHWQKEKARETKVIWPVNMFTPCPEGGLTNDQSKQRGRNVSRWTSGVITFWLIRPCVPGVTWGQSCRVTLCPEGSLTFYLSSDETCPEEGFAP